MKLASSVCESCGATLHGESPAGLCPACLLTTAIEEGDLEEAVNGARIQDYELLNEVARGGMGIVYRARQRVPPRIVALKMILPANVSSADAMQRFRVEAEAAASLEHEGILPIYAVGEHDGAPFYSMKFAEGGTLANRLGQFREKPREAAALVAVVARAVAFAHEKGILHRDLKPANVLFDSAGKPYVSDFGLAKWLARESDLTQTFAVLGTPFYMAPEQAISSHMVTASADVYSLGAILYHVLTGHPPFTGDTPMEVLRRAENQPAPRPRLRNRRIPPDLETICLKCLEKDPKRRYSSALALAEDLEHWLKHEPIRAKRSGFFTHARRWVQRNPTSALLAGCLVVLAAASGWIVWKSEFIRSPLTTGIAVLPFENLGDKKEHGAFVDGVQDDILTKLAKIADLKVISRTSVMEYRGKRNVRQIGDALRVSHVLEGSARRSGDRIHLNAQLIDTRTDTHVWAEEYDRELNDLFAVQAEIAKKVAQHLHTKLSASEKASVEERPTQDLVAYDFYVRAVSMIYNAQVPFTSSGCGNCPASEEDSSSNNSTRSNLPEAVDLLNKAVARDPNFFLAYCQLAFAHDLIGNTPARLALAKSAIDSAFRLRPDSGEAHLALAWHLFWGYSDYDRARAELALAQQSLPNNPQIYELAGSMDRSQRRWVDAIHNLERACELDPRNLPYLINFGSTYLWLHDYDQHAKVMDRIVALHPERRPGWIFRASVEVYRRAETGPLRAAIKRILTNEPGSEQDPFVAGQRYTLALYDRDWDAAGRAAAVLSRKNSLEWGLPQLGRDFWVGVVARLKGDETSARAAFMSARTQQEEEIRSHPEEVNLLSDLGLIDAGLGRKEEALNEGRRAMELARSVKDSSTEAYVKLCFAITCAWTDERELALRQLEALTKTPGFHTYGNLRLSPMWDPLRGDPRFEKIVASLAPKEMVYK